MVVDSGIAGFWGTVLFGLVSVFFGLMSLYQSIERKEQQRAIRVFSQGLYNNLQRMGAGSGRCYDVMT